MGVIFHALTEPFPQDFKAIALKVFQILIKTLVDNLIIKYSQANIPKPPPTASIM